MLTAALLGCLLGLRHASDPDHVVAVTTIVARHRRPLTAAWVGAAWGLGHSLTVLTLGAAVVTLRITIPPRVALLTELTVALLLIGLGVANVRWLGRRGHFDHAASAPPAAGFTASLARSLGVGIVHGLAGSAGVALLALAAMPTTPAALLYLAVFGLGSLGGMVAISLGLGLPFALASRTAALQPLVVGGSGALSLGLGLYLVYQSSFVRGLL